MQVEVVSKEVYQEKVRKLRYIYNSSAFQELNVSKVDKVEYLLFKNKKYRLALTVGVKDGVLKCPYSAPFGIFERIDKNVKIEDLEESLSSLEDYAKNRGCYMICYKLPPFFYDKSFIGKLCNIFYRLQYSIVNCDLNFHILLTEKEVYENVLARNAKKNLRVALKSDLAFKVCDTLPEKMEAYTIIKRNREEKGYPLRMKLEQVMETAEVLEHEFF